ncbi:hypothetical protein DBV23_05360 [Edwardsiella ictaluri]|uniref:Uncharacterized protein n=2 Tax=Edwardsiella ictaluri TaxID=67780 RepID=C5BHJ1_EDWI9|nr:hypothetical protein [Edwardsiella ictaluri]ACR67790.1 hypothetical protein NT01EI_0561 [Edwardsiella ictaluri 93-146]ARD40254.1 hypothetical protein B6E78_13510 [Edwardsiella ictaluri]AVZ81758.1 hypothetical protein DBV23_05360 [Edwardsiella ictaluri]EKS7763057.1 hypothetical protein [Edwardsiella ictaluri]EKS7770346.1 hypothetical protein [Edwardsiella ictaluri]
MTINETDANAQMHASHGITLTYPPLAAGNPAGTTPGSHAVTGHSPTLILIITLIAMDTDHA